MNLSFLTYNTLFNKAYRHLDSIINDYFPDFLCLQEVDISEKNLDIIKKYGYELADYTGTFIHFGKAYGVATYYNPKKYKLVNANSLKIGTNLQELLFTIPQILLGINKPKTVLRTDFISRSNKRIIICNAHLIVLASNAIRINHINKALNLLQSNLEVPLIIAGDFNYLPYQRKKLDNLMKKHHLIEATKNIRQTIDFSPHGKKEDFSFLQGFIARRINHFFGNQMKNDYIYYRGIKLCKTERIEVRFSDHYPILSNFNI